MAKQENQPKFVQITGTGDNLSALDEEGGVWRYYPARPGKNEGETQYACWMKITNHRVDKTGRRSSNVEA